jgi:hypothetical protein
VSTDQGGAAAALLELPVAASEDVEDDLAAGVAAFQYPVCLGRCRQREHLADPRPQRLSAQQGRATLS